jgi:hypothetical protein
MLSITAPTLAKNRASSAVLIPHIFTTSGHSTLGSLVSAQSRSLVINAQVSLAHICQSFPNKDSANALLHVPLDIFPPGDATECTQDNFLALHHVGETQCCAHVALKVMQVAVVHANDTDTECECFLLHKQLYPKQERVDVQSIPRFGENAPQVAWRRALVVAWTSTWQACASTSPGLHLSPLLACDSST